MVTTQKTYIDSTNRTQQVSIDFEEPHILITTTDQLLLLKIHELVLKHASSSGVMDRQRV